MRVWGEEGGNRPLPDHLFYRETKVVSKGLPGAYGRKHSTAFFFSFSQIREHCVLGPMLSRDIFSILVSLRTERSHRDILQVYQ